MNNPFSILKDFALALGRGELERSETIPGPGEIKNPAGTFNAMAEKVRLRETALRESEQRYRELVQNANSAIIRWKSDGTITFFNEYAQDFFGYPEEEIVGKSVGILVPEKESTGVNLTMLAKDILMNPDFYVQNVKENVRRDGSRAWMAWTNRPLLDESGQVKEILAIGTDITDRKRAEEKLQESEKNLILDVTERKLLEEALRQSHAELELRVQERTAELERKNRELQEFAVVASHDLGEPLRKIQTFGSLLAAKNADCLHEGSRDYISRMTGAANRMQELLDALLRYSRVDTKGQKFRPAKLDDIATDAAADLEIAIRKIEAHVEISPLPTVQGDPQQLRQLFQNLIANSLKYHRTEVKPFVKVYGEENNAACRIFVEDNGIGFDEKYLEEIFQPFQRLHGRKEYPGVGIGLAICRKIVDRHGCTITAKSTPGKGSTFIVTLPVDRTKGWINRSEGSISQSKSQGAPPKRHSG